MRNMFKVNKKNINDVSDARRSSVFIVNSEYIFTPV